MFRHLLQGYTPLYNQVDFDRFLQDPAYRIFMNYTNALNKIKARDQKLNPDSEGLVKDLGLPANDHQDFMTDINSTLKSGQKILTQILDLCN